MTRLKPRQESFCRLFVECGNAARAARGAGYRPESARNTGHRLLRIPRICSRIAELQATIADGQCRDVDVLLNKLEAVYRRAIDDHQLSAATRAVELQAKLGSLSSSHRGGATPSHSGAANEIGADHQTASPSPHDRDDDTPDA